MDSRSISVTALVLGLRLRDSVCHPHLDGRKPGQNGVFRAGQVTSAGGGAFFHVDPGKVLDLGKVALAPATKEEIAVFGFRGYAPEIVAALHPTA